MRVSDRAFHEANRRNLGRVGKELATAQEKAVSGRSVLKPSDDPVSMAMATRERALEQRHEVRQRAIVAGKTALDAQDQALADIADVVRQAQEAAISGANDTLTASDRSALAAQVAQLRSQALALANTQTADRYVFAGYVDDAPPFDAAGAFGGTNDVVAHEIADGLRSPAGVTAVDAFDAGGPEDLFQVLADLETALATNDEVGIRSSLDLVETAHQRISGARAEIGSHQSAYDAADAVARRLRDASVERQTELVGASEVDLFVDLQRAQDAYEAAVQVASQLPPRGLAQQ